MDRKTNKSLIERHHLAPQTGAAFTVLADQRIRVIDVKGEQVADLVCFSSRNTEEYLSSGRTIDYNEKLYFTVGDTLYSNLSNPMLNIVDDPVGRHDFLHPPCSREMFRISYGDNDPHPNCLDNLADCLEPFGIAAARIPIAFNMFMNTEISTTGTITVKPPLSKSGDYIELQARMDLIVAVTACSAGRCNNYKCTEVAVEIFAWREHQQRPD